MMHDVLLFVQPEHFGTARSHLILLFLHLSHAGILMAGGLDVIAFD